MKFSVILVILAVFICSCAATSQNSKECFWYKDYYRCVTVNKDARYQKASNECFQDKDFYKCMRSKGYFADVNIPKE